jgi:hypothetical protein
MSNNTNQLTTSLIEESLSDTSINSPNIRGILKQQMTNLEKLRQQQELKEMAKIFKMVTFIVVYAPIIGFNLYFAYSNNTSCVYKLNPFIGLNLYDYLTVQAYIMTLTLGLIIFDRIFDFRDDTIFKTFYNNYILFYRVFSIAWISIGIIILIFITYNRLCSNGIYYYVTIVTGILTFCTIVSIIQHYKDEAKLNNNST